MAAKPASCRPMSVFNTQSEVINKFLSEPDSITEQCIWQHQKEAVNQARRHFIESGNDEIGISLIVLPTGCGKTGVAVLSAYALNAHRVLVITPSLKISSQMYDAFCHRDKNFLMTRGIFPRDNATYQNGIPNGKCIEKVAQINVDMNCPLMVVNAHKIGGRSRIQIDEIPQEGYDLVIVDEAHHYPAATWRLLINHFDKSKRLFLTATPYHKGTHICYLPTDKSPPKEIPICFKLHRQEAITRGIIREVTFEEIPNSNEQTEDGECERMETEDDEDKRMKKIAAKIKETLRKHDQEDPKIKHQAMVLTQQRQDLNAAMSFKEIYQDGCEVFITGSKPKVVENFNKNKFSTLIIVGKLLEGYDNPNVSVVAIVRNVSINSRVLFAQFVGRAVRKAHKDDPVTTTIISHVYYKQKQNFDQFDKIAEDDILDNDD